MRCYISKSQTAVAIFTGIGGSVEGYKEKYTQIAQSLYLKHGVSVFIVPVESWAQQNTLIEESILEIEKHFKEMQIEDYEIYLMGTSAGASFILNQHYKYERVKKVLAINPVLCMNLDKIISALNQTKVPITFVFAEKDPSCQFLKIVDLEKEGRNKVEIIAEADHEFTEHFDEYLSLPERYLF